MNDKAIPRLPDMDLLNQIKNYGVPINDKQYEANKKGAIQKTLADEFLINLRIMDLQDYIQRYQWFNLPEGIDQELLERMFYYRGAVGFFYEPAENKAYILPYVLNGSIDMYGRYTGVSFLPFNGKAESDKKNIYIPGEGRKPVYDVVLPEELTEEIYNNSCVLCTDYSKQYAQKIKPRAETQECILQIESEIYPFARTALIANTGIRLLKVNTSAEAQQASILNQAMYQAALNGDTNLGYVGSVNTEVLDNPTAAKPDDYLLYLQSLENIRLSFLGLENGGIFKKNQYQNNTEQGMLSLNTSNIYNDGLKNRQRWCTIINSIYGLDMWCMPSETQQGVDTNGDGLITNGEEQPSTTPQEDEEDNTDANLPG